MSSPTADAVLGAMRARYACKRFDPDRPAAEEARAAVLEAGRLSPSSFGLEPWLFVVSESAADKEALFEACFRQDNVATASFVVTVAVRTARHYAPGADFVRARAERFPGGLPAFLEEYVGYYEYLEGEGRLEEWARAQGYIACANMMTAAAAAGLDSCALEGYKEDEVRRILGLDPADWRVSIVVPFGHRGEVEREKIREPLASVVLLH